MMKPEDGSYENTGVGKEYMLKKWKFENERLERKSQQEDLNFEWITKKKEITALKTHNICELGST